MYAHTIVSLVKDTSASNKGNRGQGPGVMYVAHMVNVDKVGNTGRALSLILTVAEYALICVGEQYKQF
ncbi:unnamed protein product [Protopolystoma xenopodis]|uniref:Uncharacterized protein n=1 Tax=Protopolystoma xenopodis TaxID=117903 RepID=A0A448XHF9_9PLAT|nr:unnamed protein product [Protopolystoma xenopodis]